MALNFTTPGGETIVNQPPDFRSAPGGDITLQYQVTGDVTTGRLVKTYSPLRVMDDGNDGTREFTTGAIELDPNTSIDLVLQPSFDRSINLIINDRATFPKLVNSGFIVRGSNYEITNETLYDDTAGDFDDQISLFNVNRNSRPELRFEGVSESGSLSAGNYFYYFRLSDNEGNTTDIVEESRVVFVANGAGATTTGGETTNKAVQFELSAVDSTRFRFVEVSYERFTGEGGAISNAFTLDEKFPVDDNGRCNIFHSGQEAETAIDGRNLSSRFTIINRAQSITQYNNRLFLANVELESETFEDLAAFAHAVTVRGSKSDTIGFNPDFYADPINVYNLLGYWQLEYYAVGIVFVLKSGGLTPAFPVTGITTDIDSIFEDTTTTQFRKLQFDTRNGWYQQGNEYRNSNGIIRMPKKDSITDILSLSPTFPDSSSQEFQAVEDKVASYFFVRADRRVNDRYTFAQGTQVNTLGHFRGMIGRSGTDHISPGAGDAEQRLIGSFMYGPRTKTSAANSLPYNYRRASWDFNGGDRYEPDTYPIGEYQFIPAPRGYTQAMISNTYGEPFVSPPRDFLQIQAGAWDTYFENEETDGYLTGPISGRRYALYCIDYMINSAEFEERYGNGINQDAPLALPGFVPNGAYTTRTERIEGRQENIPSDYRIARDTVRVHELTNPNSITLWENARSNNGQAPVSSASGKTVTVEDIVTVRGGINAPAGNAFSGLLTGTTGVWGRGEGPTNSSSRAAGVLFFNNEYAPYIGIDYGDVPNSGFMVNISPRPRYSSVGLSDEDLGQSAKYMYVTLVHSQGFRTGTNENRMIFPPIKDNTLNVGMLTNLPGALANAPLSVAYSDISSRTFKAISSRLPLGQQPANVYGGDCYIGRSHVKVFRGASTIPASQFFFGRDDNAPSIVNISPTAGRVHYHMGLFSENNYNPYSRQEEVDTSSLERRTFFPVTNFDDDAHALTAHVSYISNLGLSETVGSSNYTFFNINLPGRNTAFDARVYYTAVAVTDNFKNAFREITGLQFRDYNRKYGPINKITDDRQNLVIIQDSAISKLPTNQQVVLDNILIGEFGVLPERQNVITDRLGSRFYDSIVKSSQGIYGMDVDRNKIWRLGDGIETISDNAVASIMYPWVLGLTDEEREVFGIATKDISYLSNNVIATYDDVQNKVRFLLATSDPDLPTVNNSAQTSIGLTYNERLGVWESKISYNPLKWFNLRGVSISIPADIMQGFQNLSLWQHWAKNFRRNDNTLRDSGDFVKLPYANFYGTQYKMMFEFVVTDDTQFQKILDNLKVIGNKAIPSRIIYTIAQDDYSFPTLQGTTDTLYLRTTDLPSNQLELPQFNEGVQITEDIIERDNSGVASNIIVANYDYVEDHAYINVGKSMLDDTYFSGRIRGVRDKAIKVRFEYDKPDYLYIQAVIALFRTSVS